MAKPKDCRNSRRLIF